VPCTVLSSSVFDGAVCSVEGVFAEQTSLREFEELQLRLFEKSNIAADTLHGKA
jgi:hypothetical protein